MQPLRERSIRQKITLVILLTSSVVLLLACAVLFVFQAWSIKQSFTSQLGVMGEIVANNVAVAAMFQDEERAAQTLAGLAAMPQIVCACLDLKDGKRLAHFGKEDDAKKIEAMPLDSGFRDAGNRVLLAQPVLRDGQRQGTLYLLADFRAMYADLLKLYAGILALVLAGSLLLAFLLSSRFQGFVTAPILRLAATARQIAEQKDYAVRAEEAAGAEVGVLTGAFNKMLAQIQTQDAALQGAHRELREQLDSLNHEMAERQAAEEALRLSQQKLMETSRLAGMAEVATGVLHNVGNVLNSVNVSASLMVDRLRRSKAPKLGKAAELLTGRNGGLAEYLTQDESGRKLPGYLAKLGQYLLEENTELLSEADQLSRNIEHIKEVVAMQQSYAKVSGVFEDLSAERLVEDAIAMNIGAFERHGLTLERKFSPAQPVRVDRHRVLQILINLIRNAKYALDDAKHTDKRMTISIEPGEGPSVRVVVADNGIGIPAENLTRIFGHGFTTRKDGHGFGLHSGANAAKEMGGSLNVQSRGLGHGATFTLELPVASIPTHA